MERAPFELSQTTCASLYATAHWLHANARHAEAATVFRLLVLAAPFDERGWLGLAACHEAASQAEIALALYEIACEAVRAGSARCELGRARALRSAGRRQEATEAARRAALAADANDPDVVAIANGEEWT
jgi:hypothetical protein